MSLRGILISVLVGKSAGVGLLDSTVTLTLTCLESSMLFSTVVPPFYSLTKNTKRFHFLYKTHFILFFKIIIILTGARARCACDLHLIALKIGDIKLNTFSIA